MTTKIGGITFLNAEKLAETPIPGGNLALFFEDSCRKDRD